MSNGSKTFLLRKNVPFLTVFIVKQRCCLVVLNKNQHVIVQKLLKLKVKLVKIKWPI